MKKCFFITLMLFTCLFPAFSQNANTIWIDSLKKGLPALNDSAKVDRLNELAMAFGSMGSGGWDSIYTYASAANKEAVRIGYKRGEAFSLLGLAGSERKNLLAAEVYIKQAISIGEAMKDPKVLGFSYLVWSWNLLNEQRLESLKRALSYFEQAGYSEGIAEANTWLCAYYTSKGKYEESFQFCDKCVQLSKLAARTPWGHELVLMSIGSVVDLYQNAGDYETALDYSRQGNQYAKEYKLRWNMEINISSLFTQLGQYDSALYYWKKWENSATPYALNHRFYITGVLGEIYLKTKQYDKALAIAKEGIVFFKTQSNEGYSLTGHLLSAAKVYREMKNYKTALEYASEGLKQAEKNDIRPSMMEGYQLLADIYHHLGNNTNAYFYLQKHMTLKDSILNRQFFLRLNNYKKAAEDAKKEARLGFLDRDNKLKEEQLKKEAQLKKFLLLGFVGLLLIGFFIFRWLTVKRKNEQLKNEKKQTELQQRAVELEMQALRAQMNPHFIFNCLSSINRFIFKNDNKTASDYLTRFSRLIRMVLMHSQKKLIPLEDELETIRLYLDLERLRFKDAFDYSITTTNIVDVGNIFIPPLLLQPFCENAVWHGLMHKDSKGHLNVIISEVIIGQEKGLDCVIEDDGIDRKKAAELKSKSAENEKSLGLKITTERMALLNQGNHFSSFYKIEDVLNEKNEVAGTRVELKIRYKESVEEPG